jgi:hypothetical protein
VNITTAPITHAQDVRARQTRYVVSMLIRTACFVGAIVASGPLRWVLVVAALFLPYIAVVFANAGSRRAPQNATFAPEPFGMLEPGPPRDTAGEARPPNTEAG